MRKSLGDLPLLRTNYYVGTLGQIGEIAARALGVEKWLDLAWRYPAYPQGGGFPLGWSDPVGGPWIREGLGIVYEGFNVEPGLDISVEEARGCFLWMVVILRVLDEAWYRVERFISDIDEYLAETVGEPEEDDDPRRWVIACCEQIIAQLEAGRWPEWREAIPWFQELAARAAAVTEEGEKATVSPWKREWKLPLTTKGLVWQAIYGDSPLPVDEEVIA